jgi:hypothetical protein
MHFDNFAVRLFNYWTRVGLICSRSNAGLLKWREFGEQREAVLGAQRYAHGVAGQSAEVGHETVEAHDGVTVS